MLPWTEASWTSHPDIGPLSSSHKQRRTEQLPGQQPGQQAPQREQALPDFEQVVQGGEISPDIAEYLTPQMGNEAVLALLAQGGASSLANQGGELEEEEVVELEEELGELELEVKAVFGGGGGDGAADGEADPWEVGKLFGGSDDPSETKPTSAGPGMSAPATVAGRGDDHQEERDDTLPPDAFDAVSDALPTSPPLLAEQREGDARYQAVEGGLSEPQAIGRRDLKPEDLVDRTGHLDPLGRPAAIGRFLAASGTKLESRILARVIAGPVSAVLPAASGHAGAAARLAGLAICAEATEGEWEHTDRCTALSLVRDAWPDAVLAARQAVKTRRLVAPEILRLALGEALAPDMRTPSETERQPTVCTVRLGTSALEQIIPAPHIPTLPPVQAHAPAPTLQTNPDIAAADAALARFTGGDDPADLPPDPVLSLAAIRPLLNGTTLLINALGRAQVELAAAALAVARVRPQTRTQQILIHGDKALRKLAQSVVRSGDMLHRAKGTPLSALGTLPQEAHAQLLASASALRGLRSWVMSALSQELSR